VLRCCLLLALLISNLPAHCQDASQPDPVFKVDVNLVVVDAQVLKKKTHPSIHKLFSSFMRLVGSLTRHSSRATQLLWPRSTRRTRFM